MIHVIDVETIVFAPLIDQRSAGMCEIGKTLGTRVSRGKIRAFGVKEPLG